jgi:hypothetical protein
MKRCAARSQSTALWILDSGTTGSLNLFCQLPGCAVAFKAQGARHYQRILLSRFRKHMLVPEGARAVLLEGSSGKDM